MGGAGGRSGRREPCWPVPWLQGQNVILVCGPGSQLELGTQPWASGRRARRSAPNPSACVHFSAHLLAPSLGRGGPGQEWERRGELTGACGGQEVPRGARLESADALVLREHEDSSHFVGDDTHFLGPGTL